MLFMFDLKNSSAVNDHSCCCCLDLVSACRGILDLQVFQVPLASQEQAYRARRQVFL